MKFEINEEEYQNIVSDILSNKEFQKLENCPHHKTSRLDHSKRVSLTSYKICKKLNLDYVSASRAGLLHDFFINKYTEEKKTKLIREHPKIAVINSKKYFKLNKKEINIIESHMFPLNFKIKPKYAESFIVSVVDKISCIHEKLVGNIKSLNFKLYRKAIYIFISLLIK